MNKTFDEAEVKAVSESGELEGYAAVFNNVDMQNDCILEGAFSDSVSTFLSDGHLFKDHDWQQRLGYISDAREDSRGLFFKARFYTTKVAREALKEVRERFKAGRKIALSIGFTPVDTFARKDGARVITKARLLEVSLVSFGANSLAAVTGLKSLTTAEEIAAEQDWRDEVIANLFRGLFDERLNGMQVRFRRNALAEMEAKAKNG